MDSNLMVTNAGLTQQSRWKRICEIFLICLRLGCTSFGGPLAHIGYFRNQYVHRLQWITEKDFVELVALCQVLPGPSSSQLGIAIGTKRAGLIGGIIAWLGFTLPSTILMTALGYASSSLLLSSLGWARGLMLVAVAVVAQALIGMVRNAAFNGLRITISVSSLIISLLFVSPLTQVLLIVSAGLAGVLLEERVSSSNSIISLDTGNGRRRGIYALTAFILLLGGLPLLHLVTHSSLVDFLASFYRAGAFVFGGGHVVLPLLQSEFVQGGWVTSHQFLTGYGGAQAMPGPMFSFAAYLGTTIGFHFPRWIGALLATVAIFLPGFLLVIGALPFWDVLRRKPVVESALGAVNAAVIGILAAAIYNPIWTSAIGNPLDVLFAGLGFCMLVFFKLPPWVVVIVTGLFGLIPYSI